MGCEIFRDAIQDAKLIRAITEERIMNMLNEENTTTDDVAGYSGDKKVSKADIKALAKAEVDRWVNKNLKNEQEDENDDIDYSFLDDDEDAQEALEYIDNLELEEDEDFDDLDDDETDEEMETIIKELEAELDDEDEYEYTEDINDEDEEDDEDEYESLYGDKPLSQKQYDKQMAAFKQFNQYWMNHQPFSQMRSIAPLGTAGIRPMGPVGSMLTPGGRSLTENQILTELKQGHSFYDIAFKQPDGKMMLTENQIQELEKSSDSVYHIQKKIVPTKEEKKRLMEFAGIKPLDKVKVTNTKSTTGTKRQAGIIKTVNAKAMLAEWNNEAKGKDVLKG